MASPAAVRLGAAAAGAGTAAFSGLALLMAGTLRAEATLAAANLLYLIMLGLGGVLFPLTRFPRGGPAGAAAAAWSGALSDGLRSVLAHGGGLPVATCSCSVPGRWPGSPLAARASSGGSSSSATGCPRSRPRPASVLVFAGIISVQLGAGLAGRMFAS